MTSTSNKSAIADEIAAVLKSLEVACEIAGAEAIRALSKLRELLPLMYAGSLVVSSKRSVFSLAKKMPGVNRTKVHAYLGSQGYLYKQEGIWHVKADHLDLFEERLTDEDRGKSQIVAKKAGFLLLTELYHCGALPMKKGCKPQSYDRAILEGIFAYD